MNNQNEIIEIFASESFQTAMIKDLLEANGIEVFIENELMGNIATWNTASEGVAPVKIKKFKSDLANSEELIESFTKGNS